MKVCPRCRRSFAGILPVGLEGSGFPPDCSLLHMMKAYAEKADAVLNDKFPRAHETLRLVVDCAARRCWKGHHLEHLRIESILLKHVVAEPLSLKDLALLDGDLARGLDALLNMDPDDVPSLCLTWSVSDDLRAMRSRFRSRAAQSRRSGRATSCRTEMV